MRVLVLLRHGQAASTSPTGDAGRLLTPTGRDQARDAGAGMRALGMQFDEIWHSPFARAKQTCDEVNTFFGVKNVREDDGLTPNGNAADVAKRLFSCPARSLLVVSHLPLLPAVAAVLAGGARIDLATAGAISLVVYGGSQASNSCVLSAILPVEVLSGLVSPRS